MRDYQTLHTSTQSKGTSLLLPFYISVTVESSTMSVKRPLACSWVTLFISINKHYIWASLPFRCQLVYKILLDCFHRGKVCHTTSSSYLFSFFFSLLSKTSPNWEKIGRLEKQQKIVSIENMIMTWRNYLLKYIMFF